MKVTNNSIDKKVHMLCLEACGKSANVLMHRFDELSVNLFCFIIIKKIEKLSCLPQMLFIHCVNDGRILYCSIKAKCYK